MNASKTEVIYFGSRQQLAKCMLNSIKVIDSEIIPVSVIRYLGAWLDSVLSMENHVNIKSSKAMYNLYKIKYLWPFLDEETTVILVHALVFSHLDYSNSILAGASAKHIMKLQRVQNIAAKLVLKRNKYDSTSQAMKKLHWLLIECRIEYKILCLMHKCVHFVGLKYLQSLICLNPGCGKGLHSDDQHKLTIVPRVQHKQFASRCFSVFGPKCWNSLPNFLRNIEKHEDFKGELKTFLFVRHYGVNDNSIYYYY